MRSALSWIIALVFGPILAAGFALACLLVGIWSIIALVHEAAATTPRKRAKRREPSFTETCR